MIRQPENASRSSENAFKGAVHERRLKIFLVFKSSENADNLSGVLSVQLKMLKNIHVCRLPYV
jgi:hypothetical protein